MDYFAEIGLSLQEIRELKAKIDNDPTFRYIYFFTGTWNPKKLHGLTDDQLEKLREKQINTYIIHLLHEVNAHAKVNAAISRPQINYHFHMVFRSEKPITAANARRFWKHGTTDYKRYDPLFGEKLYLNPDRNCVSYIFGKHHEHRQLLFGDVYCPCKKKSCRRGNCRHRKEDYKRKSIVKLPMV